jgi:protein ImuB
MRRVISVWFPTFPTDRLCRIDAGPPEAEPFITSAHDGRRRIVAAANAAAQELGIRPGLALASAQALVPGLTVLEAEPEADRAALTRIATSCLRYAPLVAADPPDGAWIDATGCAHLAGGEAAMLTDLVARLGHAGFTARAAIADTPGAAHAVARYGGQEDTAVVPVGGVRQALAALPVQALRLPLEVVESLRRLGLDRVGDLMAAPRAPLVKRFGTVIALRLAQALGEQSESIRPLTPPEVIEQRLAFAEPIRTAESFAAVLDRLMRSVCRQLEGLGLGARSLDLMFERMDNSVQAVRIGTAQPSRDALHLTSLLREQFELVDPGEGVEAMRLVAATAEPLPFAQVDALPTRAVTNNQDLAALLDRLINRYGADRIYRAEPVESDVPERAVTHIAPLAPSSGHAWPVVLPRPVRLLAPPQPVEILALLPDHPPAAFTWRRRRHRVRHADGPERIAGEWWRREGEAAAVRDYFAVEDEVGQRFWLFRRGDGQDPATGDLRWFLHGFF